MSSLLVHQELSSSSVEVPVVHSGSTVLIVSPPNISSTLTGNRKQIHFYAAQTETMII